MLVNQQSKFLVINDLLETLENTQKLYKSCIDRSPVRGIIDDNGDFSQY